MNRTALIIVGALVLLGILLFVVVGRGDPADPGLIRPAQQQSDSTRTGNKFGAGGCKSNPSPIFTNHFTDPTKIDSIVPPFFEVGDNEYKSSSLVNTTGRVPVYMPINGKLIQGSHYLSLTKGDYLLDFEVSCEVMVSFDHITEPIPAIKALLPSTPQSDSRTQFFDDPPVFAAGDLIGYTTGTDLAKNWNVATYNKSNPHTLMTDPEFSQHEKNRIFDCFYDYYPPNMRQTYTKLFTADSGDIRIIKNICSN